MLMLSRKPGETLLIGDDIRVTIKEIRGNQVRIGIDAPKRIAVDRAEVRERINNEKNNS